MDVNQGKWLNVRRYLYAHRAEQDQLKQTELESEHGRDIQVLGAIALRSVRIPWNRFVGWGFLPDNPKVLRNSLSIKSAQCRKRCS